MFSFLYIYVYAQGAMTSTFSSSHQTLFAVDTADSIAGLGCTVAFKVNNYHFFSGDTLYTLQCSMSPFRRSSSFLRGVFVVVIVSSIFFRCLHSLCCYYHIVNRISSYFVYHILYIIYNEWYILYHIWYDILY